MPEGKYDAEAFSPGDLMRRVANLEREVRALQTARRLEAATIGAGGVRVTGGGSIFLDGGNVDITEGALLVRNADGQVVAALGKLPDGTYGVAAIDTTTGALVALSTLAFGIRSVTNGGLGTRNNINYGDLTGLPVGPTVPDVPIGTSRRAIVMLTAQTLVTDNAGRSGLMSFEVSGATTLAADDGRAHIVDIGGTTGGQNISPRQTAAILVDGLLTPGLNTFTAKFRTLTAGGNVSWISPNITVIPF